MGSRFVRPDVLRLPISGGDFLIVKRRLTAGEQREAYARMYPPNATNGKREVDPLQIGISMVLAFLVDWSLTDDEGRPVEIKGQPIEVVRSALDALDPESYAEIRAAIDDHEAAMARERDELKKIRDGERESLAISPSPSALAGAMSGSAT